MKAAEIQERYGDLLKAGKLTEVLDLVTAQTEPMEVPEEPKRTDVQDLKTVLTGILSHVTSDPDELEKQKKIIAEFEDKKAEERREAVKKVMLSQTESFNRSQGYMDREDGISCDKCKNKGYIEIVAQNKQFGYYYQTYTECECMKARKSWRRIQRSGLAGYLTEMTLDRFEVSSPWQRSIKNKALAFLAGEGGYWFYVGGQVGSGKSHVCTAVCGEMLKKGRAVQYMKWAEESVELKSKVNDENYATLLGSYKTADVLYIDDFFKVPRGGATPSAADIKLAYQIIDYRYCNKLTTIISSEWLDDELFDFDEAVASRIFQMAKGSTVLIGRSKDRNYRRTMLREAI